MMGIQKKLNVIIAIKILSFMQALIFHTQQKKWAMIMKPSDWISVDERLPIIESLVLCFSDGDIFSAWYTGGRVKKNRFLMYVYDDLHFESSDFSEKLYDKAILKITHWMPIVPPVEKLRNAGYKCEACWSADEAIRVIDEYLS